jgi:hypothetical protein
MFENLARLTEEQPTNEHVITFADIENDDAILVRILSCIYSDSSKKFDKLTQVNAKWKRIIQLMQTMNAWYRKTVLSLQKKVETDVIETNISFFDLPKCFYEMPLDTYQPMRLTNDQRMTVTFLFPKFDVCVYNVIVEAVDTLVQEEEERKNRKSRYHEGFLRDDVEDDEEEIVVLKKRKLFIPPSFALMHKAITKHNAVITLNHGGYYATSMFDIRGKEIRHKTFHKYVTRKKQGGRQITQDKTKRAKSMGSQIRRSQEEHFKEELEEHLVEWHDYLSPCQMIFIHAPGPYNESLLFDFEESPLNQQYCYTIPFNTQQPTNSQVIQASQKLFNVTLIMNKM